MDDNTQTGVTQDGAQASAGACSGASGMCTITNTGTGAKAQAPIGSSFRDVAQAQNLDVPFGCESGICSTCLIQIGKGAEHLGPKTEQEEFTLDARGLAPDDMNTRLGCQCKVSGDVEFHQGM